MRGISLLLVVMASAACGADGGGAPVATGTDRGTLRLVSVATGVEVDSSYSAVISDGSGVVRKQLLAGVAADVEVAAGTHAIVLDELSGNCRVVESLPLSATVVAGGVTTVPLTVTCEASAYVLLTAVMTAVQLPTDGIEVRCRDVGCGSELFAGGTALLRLRAGPHTLELANEWCMTEPPRAALGPGVVLPSLDVVAVAGDTTRYDFPIECP